MNHEAGSLKRLAKERIEAELRGKAQIHGGFGDVALANKLQRRLDKLENETWLVDGKALTRPEVMAFVVEQMCEGHSLVEIAWIPGMPTLRGLMAWRKSNPQFEEMMKDAEEVRGLILAERSLDEAMKATGARDAPSQKLKADQLRWMASKHNKRFEDKQVHEHHMDITNESEERLVGKLALIMNANPEIKRQLGFEDANVQDAEIVPEGLQDGVPGPASTGPGDNAESTD
jgi:hypothetical protein